MRSKITYKTIWYLESTWPENVTSQWTRPAAARSGRRVALRRDCGSYEQLPSRIDDRLATPDGHALACVIFPLGLHTVESTVVDDRLVEQVNVFLHHPLGLLVVVLTCV
jgi:hypothetical protein